MDRRHLKGLIWAFGSLAWLGSLCLSAAATPNEEPSSWSDRVVRLRSEVRELDARVQVERDRLADLDRRVDSEIRSAEISTLRYEARIAQLSRRIRKARRRIEEDRVQAEVLRESLLEVSHDLLSELEVSLPFRLQGRRSRLEEIRAALAETSHPLSDPAGDLWQFMRDELRLSRSHGLARQPVPIEEPALLAEVVRLGTVALLFQVSDGRTGYTRPASDGFRFVWSQSSQEAQAIRESIEAMKRGAAERLPIPAACLVRVR
jgi:hypothetical protein